MDPYYVPPAAKAALVSLERRRSDLGYTAPCQIDPSMWDTKWEQSLEDYCQRAKIAIALCRSCAVLTECDRLRQADPTLEGIVAATLRDSLGNASRTKVQVDHSGNLVSIGGTT